MMFAYNVRIVFSYLIIWVGHDGGEKPPHFLNLTAVMEKISGNFEKFDRSCLLLRQSLGTDEVGLKSFNPC